MDHNNKHNNILPGLPPLPKSLSSAATSNNSSPLNHQHQHNHHHPQQQQQNHATYALDHEIFAGASTSNSTSSGRLNQRQNHRHGSLSSTQESLSDRESVHSRASSSHSNHQAIGIPVDGNGTVAGTATLDTQLAILRREMYGLRQLDLSLLSQLWALNESIQGFRVFLQEQETLSPPSPSSPTPSETNSLTSEPDEDDCFAQPMSAPPLMPPPLHNMHILSHAGIGVTGTASSSTASHASSSSISGASSATSSMGKNAKGMMMPPLVQKTGAAHPQLPRILQQRMRRAPPPPPPTQAAQIASMQHQQQQQQQQALMNKNMGLVQQPRHV